MPPALVPLALLAIGIPASLRALFGWPRALATAWVAAVAAVAVAQVLGELTGIRAGVLGDAQLLLAGVGATLASLAVAAFERR